MAVLTFDISLSVVHTLRGFLLCNRLSEDSPVFVNRQRHLFGSVWVPDIFIFYRIDVFDISSHLIGFLECQ